MNKMYIAGFTVAVFLGCVVITHAHGPIPGVDEPYDPPDYYSPVSVSVPDSAPSPFTLKDIANQGGSVYDPERHVETTEAAIKSAIELNNQHQSLLNEIQNITTTISLKGFNRVEEIINEIKKVASKGPDLSSISLVKYFRDGDAAVDPRRTFDDEEKYKYLESVYKNAATVAGSSTINASSDALVEAMDDSINAQGEVDARKAEAEINSVVSAERVRRNVLQNQMNAVMTVSAMNEADKENKAYSDNKQLKIFFADPYHPDSYAKNFEREKGAGFIDFK